MKNKLLRETIGFLSNDAKEWLKTLPDGLESLDIVDRQEDEIVAYIEALERENAKLKARLQP